MLVEKAEGKESQPHAYCQDLVPTTPGSSSRLLLSLLDCSLRFLLLPFSSLLLYILAHLVRPVLLAEPPSPPLAPPLAQPSSTLADMDRTVSFKIHIIHQHFLLFVLLLLHPEVSAAAAGGRGEQPTVCEETAWLTFSTHDLELVATEHENATVLLQAWGSFSRCLTINFQYNPSSPSIEPLDDLILCPSLNNPTLLPSTTSHSSKHLSPLSLAFKSSSSSSAFFSRPSASPHPPPPLPSSSPPHKRCRGCGVGHEEIPLEAPLSTHIHRRPSLPLHLQGRALRDVGGAEMVSSAEGAIANISVEIVSRWVGKTVVDVTTNSSCVEVTDAFVRVSVIHTQSLNVASDVIGWVYTILWDISFIPQVWLNWRRKSVEGLSLDNVTLNFVAYLYYALFNVAFLYVPLIQEQFKERYPRSVNQVRVNDLFFSAYAFFMETVVVIQCLMWGRNKGLYVSWPCWALTSLSVLAVGVECVLVGVDVLWWLDVFYLMSYMKLAISPLKYMPQVYVNYKRKSTEGFSMAGIVLDFMGGVLSFLQMFLLAANNNDFLSIFTNFSKFGLSIITLIFDIIYFAQHWYYHLRYSFSDRHKRCDITRQVSDSKSEGANKITRQKSSSLVTVGRS